MDVKDQLQAALESAVERGEHGVQVAAYVGDELVLDGWIGDADESGTPVDGTTLFPIFSVTKGLTCTAVHIQAERGLVDYDEPVATYWPEFGAEGKGDIKVGDILAHQSGVPQMPEGTTPERLGDWDWCVENLAALKPLLPVGSSAYASLSFGWQAGEIVRRTDPQGRDFRTFVYDEILDPLKIDDYHLGLPEEHYGRVAQLRAPGALRPDPPRLRTVSMPAPVEPGPRWNQPVFMSAVVPAGSGIANARSVAKLFSLLANKGTLEGNKILSEDRVMSFLTPRSSSGQYDDVIGQVPWVGVGGYWLSGESPPADSVLGGRPGVLASNGAGGSIAWADPETGLSVAICHNRMFSINPSPPPEEHPFTAVSDLARSLVRS